MKKKKTRTFLSSTKQYKNERRKSVKDRQNCYIKKGVYMWMKAQKEDE